MTTACGAVETDRFSAGGAPLMPKPVERFGLPLVYLSGSVVSDGHAPELTASGNFNGFQYAIGLRSR
ncbi:MAG TPA: hypothetical protein DEB39_15895 [Planctomycetaceae bacterium]|nr:hypothetical protein [Planctomycetaceae bacterium]